MKVNGDKIECLQGERFSQLMSGFDFNNTSQIVVLLYKQTGAGPTTAFVKEPTDTYPNAGLITLNEDLKMVFTIDTASMSTGDYDIEVRVDVVGVVAPIVKQRTSFLTIKESRT